MAIERFFHMLWPLHALDAAASFFAQFGIYLCIASAAFAWVRRRPRHLIGPIVVGAVIAGAADWLAGVSIRDARPFVVMGVAPLVAHANDNGFPSDHSVVAAYAATIAAFIEPGAGIAGWIAAIALGLGRMYCLLHGPLDVLAGWIIGIVPAAAAATYWRKRWITVSSQPDLT